MSRTKLLTAVLSAVGAMGCGAAGPTGGFRGFSAPSPSDMAARIHGAGPPQLTTHRPEELLLRREQPPAIYTQEVLRKHLNRLSRSSRGDGLNTRAAILAAEMVAMDILLSKELKLSRRARDRRPPGRLR